MVDQNALKSIEDLHRLKNEGVITEEDYEKAKERLLFGSRPAAATGAAPLIRAAGPVPRPAENDHFGWVTLPIKRYADFEGRSSRKEFWMFQLIYVAVGFLLTLVAFGSTDEYGEASGLGKLILLSAVLALAGLVIPLVAVQVRRLHDQDRSGWLALINLVPYVGVIVVYVLMLMEGTRGDNRFGPDPLAN